MGSPGVGCSSNEVSSSQWEKDYRVQLCCGKQHSLAHNIKPISTVKSNENSRGRTAVM